MVLNTAFGAPEFLPFDLRSRRVISYTMPEITQDRATERKRLEEQLTAGLRAILTGPAVQAPAIAVPLAYQLDALDQVLPQMKEDEMTPFSTRDLDHYISNLMLRDRIKPQFEPLVSSSVMEGLDHLTRDGRIKRTKDGGFEIL